MVGTFLLPSVFPEANADQYAVVLDEVTGIHHVARKGVIVYKDAPSTLRQSRPLQRRVNQQKTVQMPSAFKAMSKKLYKNMPKFGSFPEEPSSASDSAPDTSISIMESSTSIFALTPAADGSPDNKSARSRTSGIELVDDSILEVGAVTKQTNATATMEAPISTGSPVPSKSSANLAFFFSLFKTEELSPAAQDKDSANAAFFKSMPTSDEPVQDIKESSRDTKNNDSANAAFFKLMLNTKEPLRDAQEEDATNVAFFKSMLTTKEPGQEAVMTSNPLIKVEGFSNTAVQTLAEKYMLTTSWTGSSKDSSAILCSTLDLADSMTIMKPQLVLAELDLNVSEAQAKKYLLDVELDIKSAGYEEESWADRATQYVTPIAPGQDTLQYEEYFPSHSRSSSGISVLSNVHSTIVNIDSGYATANNTPPPGSKDDLSLALQAKPMDEWAWLDLAEAFLNGQPSDQINEQPQDDTLSSHGDENLQESDNGADVELPEIDDRQVLAISDYAGAVVNTVISSSVDNDLLNVDQDEVPITRLPGQAVKSVAAIEEISSPVSAQALTVPLSSIDLAAVFGGSSESWATDDEEDDDDDAVGTAADEEPQPTAIQISPGSFEADGDNAPTTFQGKEANVEPQEASETASTEPSEPNTVNAKKPLRIAYRLPIPLIDAINEEFNRTWTSENGPHAPWVTGVDESEALELALANTTPMHKDIPDDILHFVRDVNLRYAQLCLEFYGARGFEVQIESVMTLAVANIEWMYFKEVLDELPSPAVVTAQTKLELADPQAEWLKMIGGDAQYREHRLLEAPSSEDDESVVGHHGGRTLHHINFNGDLVYERSYTTPAVSFWAACTTANFDLSLSDAGKSLPPVHLKSVLAAQAFKWVDPVQYLGSNIDAPTDAQGTYLRGSRLQNAVIGHVKVVYQPYGNWWSDDYEEDDIIPSHLGIGDQYHNSSMPEYVFQQRPHRVHDSDITHTLLNMNDDARSNPQMGQPLPPKHKFDTPLRQELLADLETSEDAAEDAAEEVAEEVASVDDDAEITEEQDVGPGAGTEDQGASEADTEIDTDEVQESRVTVNYNAAGVDEDAQPSSSDELELTADEILEQKMDKGDAAPFTAIRRFTHAAFAILSEACDDEEHNGKKDDNGNVADEDTLQVTAKASKRLSLTELSPSKVNSSKRAEVAQDWPVGPKSQILPTDDSIGNQAQDNATSIKEDASEAGTVIEDVDVLGEHQFDNYHAADEAANVQGADPAATNIQTFGNQTGWREAYAQNVFPSMSQTLECAEGLSDNERLEWQIRAASARKTSPSSASAPRPVLYVASEWAAEDKAEVPDQTSTCAMQEDPADHPQAAFLACFSEDQDAEDDFVEDLSPFEQDEPEPKEPIEPQMPVRNGRNIDADKMMATLASQDCQSPEKGRDSWTSTLNGHFNSPKKPIATATLAMATPHLYDPPTTKLGSPPTSRDPFGTPTSSPTVGIEIIEYLHQFMAPMDTNFSSLLRRHHQFDVCNVAQDNNVQLQPPKITEFIPTKLSPVEDAASDDENSGLQKRTQVLKARIAKRIMDKTPAHSRMPSLATDAGSSDSEQLEDTLPNTSAMTPDTKYELELQAAAKRAGFEGSIVECAESWNDEEDRLIVRDLLAGDDNLSTASEDAKMEDISEEEVGMKYVHGTRAALDTRDESDIENKEGSGLML